MISRRRVVRRIGAEIQRISKPLTYTQLAPFCTCGLCIPIETSKKKIDITFLYSKGTRDLASVQMRIPQSARHILDYNSKINLTGLCLDSPRVNSLKNQIIVLTKFAARDITKTCLNSLLNKGNIVLIDPVDSAIELNKFSNIHGVIASSINQFEYFREKSKLNVKLLYHAGDFRINGIRSISDQFSIAYFGSRERFPADLLDLSKIKIIKTSLSYFPAENKPDFSTYLEEYPAHFAIGTVQNHSIFKPFTKGIIASAVGSVTLISSKETEAIQLLGKNYPYISKSNSVDDVAFMLQEMEESYLSKDWALAQECHNKLIPLNCEMSLANKWLELFEFFSN